MRADTHDYANWHQPHAERSRWHQSPGSKSYATSDFANKQLATRPHFRRQLLSFCPFVSTTVCYSVAPKTGRYASVSIGARVRGQLVSSGCFEMGLARVWWWLFPRLRGFWENVRPFIPRLRFFFFFFEVEISSRTLIPLFRPGSVHSDSAKKSQHAKLTLEKKILPPGFELATFRPRVQLFTNKLSRLLR